MENAHLVEGAERRRAIRYQLEIPASVTVARSRANGEMIGTSADGKTRDVTGNAVRLRLDAHIPRDAELDIWVDRFAHDGEFYVTGLVRWVKPVGHLCEVGVELFEGKLTDIDAWRREFSQWLAEAPRSEV